MTTNNPLLEALSQRLSGTRQRAPGTVTTYMDTAKRFLAWANDAPMDRTTVDKFFAWRRDNGVSERTLKKEFFHLKKLFTANKLSWDFDKEDVPLSEDDPRQPAFTEAHINQLIMAQDRYTDAERFYLAVSTTFGCRREELSRINKRMVDRESIVILTAKHGLKRRHLIPEVIRPVFEGYHMKEHTPGAISTMFRRIVKKAELDLDGDRWGWHSCRRCLDTLADYFLAKNDLPPSLWADFVGWAKSSRGIKYTGAAMAGVYAHPEIMSDDPYYIDRLIYPVHPFLKTWGKVLTNIPVPVTNTSVPVTKEPVPVTETPNIDTNLSPLDAVLAELKKKVGG